MKFLLGSILLNSLWSISSFLVSQTPDVSVEEGQMVNISCSWTWRAERVRVAWFKNQTMLTNAQELLSEQASDCSTLTFPNITRNDSGRYICKVSVEIPTLIRAEGNGTVITVAASATRGLVGCPDCILSVSTVLALVVMVTLLIVALFHLHSLQMNRATHHVGNRQNKQPPSSYHGRRGSGAREHTGTRETR